MRAAVYRRFGGPEVVQVEDVAIPTPGPDEVLIALQRLGGAALPGYDLLVQAMAGWMAVTGDPDGPPTKVGFALADVLTGQQAATAVLAALRARDRDGVGQAVEVSLFDGGSDESPLIGSQPGRGFPGVVPDGPPGQPDPPPQFGGTVPGMPLLAKTVGVLNAIAGMPIRWA